MTIPVFRNIHADWSAAQQIHHKYGDANQLSNFGPLVSRLEAKLAKLLEVPKENLVVFSSGTKAISAAISAFHRKNLLVQLPDFTFLASFRAAQRSNAKSIVVKDCDFDDWSLIAEGSGEVLHMPVAPFGSSPQNLLEKFSGEPAVVDAAGSLGSLPNLSTLESEHAVCFSLHSTKVLGSGEGGFSVFGDVDWASRARAWSNFGRHPVANTLESGTNAKMSEIQAAFLLAQLENFEGQLRQWKVAQKFAEKITETLGLGKMPGAFVSPSTYWVVKFDSEAQRLEAQTLLAKSDIEYKQWWPLSMASLNSQIAPPISSELRETTLGLPMFFDITEDQMRRIELALLPIAKPPA